MFDKSLCHNLHRRKSTPANHTFTQTLYYGGNSTLKSAQTYVYTRVMYTALRSCLPRSSSKSGGMGEKTAERGPNTAVASVATAVV